MNHTSGPEDVEGALPWFAQAPQPSQYATASLPAHEDPAADIRGGWGDLSVFDAETVRRLPLFAELDGGALEVVMKSASSCCLPPH